MWYMIDCLLLGDNNEGRESDFLSSYYGQRFSEGDVSSIDADLRSRIYRIYNTNIEFQIWDVTRLCISEQIDNFYYRSFAVLIFVHEVTSASSFSALNILVENIINAPQAAVLILVGNKADFESKREITYEEGQKFANEHQMIFLETSAIDGFKMNNIFKFALAEISLKVESGEINQMDPKSGIQVINCLD